MLISIAMATYNGEKYIKEQLDSILHQTISDFELLICDDCSTDSTYDILQEYAFKDGRIVVYRNSTNQGYYRNFEKLLYLCKGDYIAFCDQDDIWMPNHLELLLNAIGDKSMAFGNAIIVDEKGQSKGMTVRYQESLDRIPKNDLEWANSLYLYRSPILGTAILFKKNLLRYALPFPNMKLHDIWISCLSSMSDGIAYVDVPILKYRRLESSITGLRTDRRLKFIHCIYSIIQEDRLVIAKTILNCKSDLPLEKRKFLYKVIKMIERNGNRKGRIINRLYLLIHYYKIYNCSLTRWK